MLWPAAPAAVYWSVIYLCSTRITPGLTNVPFPVIIYLNECSYIHRSGRYKEDLTDVRYHH
jgi:hypothetical protein